jgi:hypothetical protein
MMNYKLYFDNYFTTIRLQVELKTLGIFAVGTVRSNRLPDLVMKDAKNLLEEGRGSMDHRIAQVDGVELCATRWYDNNVVNCLSTLHSCESTDLVKRWSSSQKKHIQVTLSNVVKTYNQYMGDVDLINMLVSLYRINIRSKKYYMKIIFHLIDLPIVNGWLLYRRHCSQLRLPKNEIHSLLQFWVEVAEALLKPIVRLRSKQNSPSKNPWAASVRFDGLHHWPMSTTKGRCHYSGCNIVFKLLKDKNFSDILTHFGRLLPFGNIVVFSQISIFVPQI